MRAADWSDPDVSYQRGMQIDFAETAMDTAAYIASICYVNSDSFGIFKLKIVREYKTRNSGRNLPL